MPAARSRRRAAGTWRARRRRPAPTPPPTDRRAGTRDRGQHVDLGEELDEITGARRARLDEVAPLGCEPCDLEHVEHVVHVELGQVEGRHRAHEIAVTAEVELLAVEQLVHVRVAPGPQEIVAAAAVLVPPVLDAVGRHRQHRPQIRQARPEPVEGREVRLVQLARARRPEALARVRQAPHVEVGHLRPLHGDDAEDLPRAHRPRSARSPGDDEPVDQGAAPRLARQAAVELAVDLERRARLRVVDHSGTHVSVEPPSPRTPFPTRRRGPRLHSS